MMVFDGYVGAPPTIIAASGVGEGTTAATAWGRGRTAAASNAMKRA
jgi:hypothetical protein